MSPSAEISFIFSWKKSVVVSGEAVIF